MQTEVSKPTITSFDRLTLTFTIALLLHVALILGLGFQPDDPGRSQYSTMEIMLVAQSSETQEDAKILAQADLEGGGEDKEGKPQVRAPAPFPAPTPEPTTSAPSLEQMEAAMMRNDAPQTEAEDMAHADTTKLAVDQANSTEAVAQKSTSHQPENTNATQNKNIKSDNKQQQPADIPTPSADELVENSLKIAALTAEIERKIKIKSERPKRTYLSASTKQYEYAAYMEAWRAKVERIGNINYPQKARQLKLSGSLILDVALNADGSINDIVVQKSSGEKLLDQAAVRIVEMAAPYAPFPKNIKDKTDILHILRTWQFIDHRQFRTK